MLGGGGGGGGGGGREGEGGGDLEFPPTIQIFEQAVSVFIIF